MPRYLTEAFWSSCRVAKVEIVAKDPLAALRRAQRREDDWIGDNEEGSGDCYGPTSYEVWDVDQRQVLACQPSDQDALNEHAGALLAALKALADRHHPGRGLLRPARERRCRCSHGGSMIATSGLPPAIRRRLELPRFTAAQFAATQFDDADAKARFAQPFARFLRHDMAEHLFTQVFYRQLSNTFGHIAHFNRYGFLEHYFHTHTARRRFLEDTMAWRPAGDPGWTFVDVEIALQRRISHSGLLAVYGITARPLRPIVTGAARQPESAAEGYAAPPTNQGDLFAASRGER